MRTLTYYTKINCQGHPKQTQVFCDCEQGHEKLYQDYFSEKPTYQAKLFERQFCMSKTLFLQILNNLQKHHPYWIQSKVGTFFFLKKEKETVVNLFIVSLHFQDCCGRLGLSGLQKVTAALRQLAYGYSADCTNEYVWIGAPTAIETLKNFCKHICQIYAAKFLAPPSHDELNTILKENKAQGFAGCKGSIDGMHWEWKNCPTAWAGQFHGKEKTTTMILEALASQSLRIWHSFFVTPGSLNDINVLN